MDRERIVYALARLRRQRDAAEGCIVAQDNLVAAYRREVAALKALAGEQRKLITTLRLLAALLMAKGK